MWPQMEGTTKGTWFFNKEDDSTKVYSTWTQVKSHEVDMQDALFTVKKSRQKTLSRSTNKIPQNTGLKAATLTEDKRVHKRRWTI
jgi:hypothetical protein